ncbi:SOS response-associated peptidase [Rathayibacter iranicus]|uniref:Abasic site processing protein n=2 Tax=Rathayibacter iranicus TaxID=59737 RepID=A0AAD1ADP0_9MICO|nr:SOS response-associated peptidase [Rathayibacter iranicus]AZZ56283.1 SOS response-associated peptidase [Rathayibacter iranicus]MWV30001.1 SOS response-associated peptidase [Rathayibacter iranicus NCPPB 2253 = VKM Ac-1602]PPI45895.1 SOS response-associated peptidase [Rathayibacter iranicus]PPI59724.1 SOS response-associated peptidase [Rathayibacter iranicus]PPI70733.1 SOS response-associated peptidase [Rathayibacter iranicus]
MCGRFAMDSTTDELIREFVAAGGRAQDWAPDFSIAPTDSAPIVRERMRDGEPEREIEVASWGFTPSWSKGKGASPINARLETVASNGLFRGAFAKQRAIVPMRGYYEWEARADGKQPWFVHGEQPILAAAGLYAARREGDERRISFAIITREARDSSGEVHDRMPVFLTPDIRDDWLSPEPLASAQELLATLDRVSVAIAATITAYPVDRRVNDSRTVEKRDPRVLERIG